MKIAPKYIRKLAMPLVALGMTVCLSSALRAQAQTQTSGDSGSPASVSAPAISDTSAAAGAANSSTADQEKLTAMATPDPDPQSTSTPAPAAAPADQTAQTPATPPAAPAPLPNPSMTAPLSTAAPAHTFDGGPFGTLSVTGILSGIGLVQDNWLYGDKSTRWDVSNAQIFIQKTTGWWQFYLQGGAYNLPALGVPFLTTGHTLSALYGPLPVGYMKFVKGGFSAEIGELPTLIGAEYTFTFENTNIERGLLWNQENAITKGIQLNEAYKKLSASVSWNDGFDSNRYNWISGSVAYAFNAANTLSFVAGGNLGTTRQFTFATPIQNDGAIYNVIYTYTKGNWFVQPYWQYSHIPVNRTIGVTTATSTDAGAFIFNYNFKHGLSLALRPEYITTSGGTANGALNLLYGPGSDAFSFTATPTYQKGGFFTRVDVSVVSARNSTAGDAFGYSGNDTKQVRGVIEAGFLF